MGFKPLIFNVYLTSPNLHASDLVSGNGGSEDDKDVQSKDPENEQDNPSPPQKKGAARVMKWVAWLVILTFLTTVVYPIARKQQIAADRTKALSNIRQIGLSLFEFESDYGPAQPFWGGKQPDLKWQE